MGCSISVGLAHWDGGPCSALRWSSGACVGPGGAGYGVWPSITFSGVLSQERETRCAGAAALGGGGGMRELCQIAGCRAGMMGPARSWLLSRYGGLRHIAGSSWYYGLRHIVGCRAGMMGSARSLAVECFWPRCLVGTPTGAPRTQGSILMDRCLTCATGIQGGWMASPPPSRLCGSLPRSAVPCRHTDGVPSLGDPKWKGCTNVSKGQGGLLSPASVELSVPLPRAPLRTLPEGAPTIFSLYSVSDLSVPEMRLPEFMGIDMIQPLVCAAPTSGYHTAGDRGCGCSPPRKR